VKASIWKTRIVLAIFDVLRVTATGRERARL
jgi:hypothetical protein